MTLVRVWEAVNDWGIQTESGRCERRVDIVCEDDGRQSHGSSGAISQECATMDRPTRLTQDTPLAQLRC